MFEIVTKTDVNIRSGPGMAFEVVSGAKRGMAFDSTEYRKDGGKTGWYKTGLGWICAEYVSLAKDMPATQNAPFKIQRFAEEDEEKKTKEVTAENTKSSTEATNADNVARDPNGGASGESSVDILLEKRYFGLPYQFMKNVDIRQNSQYVSDKELGIAYKETMAEAPYISIIPGKPLFLPDLSNEDRENYFKAINETLNNTLGKTEDWMMEAGGALTGQGDVDIKYFMFQKDYINYIMYVNTLCWLYADFLGIANDSVPGFEGDKHGTFGDFNWARWRASNLFAHRQAIGASNLGNGMLDDDLIKAGKSVKSAADSDGAMSALSALLDATSAEEFYTQFYINPSVSFSETFSNDTKSSMLEGLVSGVSEYAKEIGFLLQANAPTANTKNSQAKLGEMIKEAGGSLGGSGVLGRIFSATSAIISGANMAFPKLWSSSSYNKSFSIDIPLRTAYGNRKSIFMDIIVPMCHWICLAAPRQLSVNTYNAPFLVRGFVPGYFSVDMGIISSLTITKGGDGSARSVDGLPLEVNLSVQIDDLYSALFISRINAMSITDAYNFMYNNALLDYVGVNSGLNMTQSEFALKLDTLFDLWTKSGTNLANQTQDTFREWLASSKRSLAGILNTR